LAFVLSRVAFLMTHLVFAVWLNYLFNDPFNLGGPTLDARTALPAATCNKLNTANLQWDLMLLFGWWAQHSVMARKKFKVAVGLWQRPIERPLFATASWIMWFVQIWFWRPITDCVKWNPLNVSAGIWAVSATVLALGALLIVGLLWSLPSHVFGTDRHKYETGKYPTGKIIRKFPYGLVRHPAAAGFTWMYWALPAYTPNHLLLAGFWTVFILVGTLVFEEGGLRGPDEFGKEYAAYAKDVNALVPNPKSISAVFFPPADTKKAA
jgi:protein-S-isoprenylcysteine O-methyltransferase Ste14